MKKCPFCAEEIQDKAIRCKHCGKNLKTSALTFIGNGWAILGAINIFLGLRNAYHIGSNASYMAAAITLFISLIVFIIPGLICAHIGKK